MKLAIAGCCCVLLFAGPAFGEDGWAGEWMMTSMSMSVTTSNWGENCGPKPESYSSRSQLPVQIRVNSGHLFFSKTDLRTDRCSSPNLKLQKVSASRSNSTWKMVCQTPKDDPKFERGTYTLTAVDENRLEFTNVSRFDWTLKGDRCVAASTERRVYVRKSEESANPPKSEAVSPKKKDESAAILESMRPWCEPKGPVARIVITPPAANIGPGEKICLNATAYDSMDCRKSVNVRWSVTQNEQPVRGRISPNGCFSAGANAADAEGEYVVTARVGAKAARAVVSVVFPDLVDLLAARLRPLETLEKMEESKPNTNVPKEGKPSLPRAILPPPPPTSIQGNKGVMPTDSGQTGTWILVTLLLATSIAGIAGFRLLRRSQRKSRNERMELDDWPNQDQPKNQEDLVSDQPKVDANRLCCPSCNRIFDEGALFCPYDKASLVPMANAANLPKAGMICPKCHRGYDAGARFCPHDSEKLVPYESWRLER